MKKRKKIDSQLLISFGVLFTSFAALFVSFHQATIMNKQTDVLLEQTKSSAWPHLNIGLQRSYTPEGPEGYHIYIDNKGTGPAIIEAVSVRYDEKVIRNWTEFYNETQVPKSMVGHDNSNINNKVIAANETIKLIGFVNKDFIKYMLDNGEKLSIEICYKSVYGDEWSIKRNGFKTNLEPNIKKSVDVCSISKEELFVE